ncbi:uncharacterized protein [Diabrotica undecimpunctata]|uniref:uncharacterized protein n=1 Tax=Diabrotica undecimpunctata TaxID=50387 RepID=UPI003B634A2D
MIIKEGKNKPATSQFLSPRTSICKPNPKSSVNPFEEHVIRNTIYTFATIHKRRPTMKAVYESVRNEGIVTGKLSSFRKIVKKLGFRWRTMEDNRKLLIEKTDIRAKRTEFLRKLKKYKSENRNIVYSDETYIHSSHTVPKGWDDGRNKCIKSPVSKGQRLIILHCGGKNGFVENAALIFKSGQKTCDYHDDMNHQNYIKWLKDKLLPNLPSNSVLVIDNASYHNVTLEKCPTSASKKDIMKKWLTERNIFFDESETKPELYSKVLIAKPKNPVYAVDQLLAQHGHSVLRLPPYHPELNPIEKIWAILKNEVAARNTTFKLADVLELAKIRLNEITPEIWANTCRHVDKVEEEYFSREYILDEAHEIIINLDDDSESSETELSDSDDDYGYNNDL